MVAEGKYAGKSRDEGKGWGEGKYAGKSRDEDLTSASILKHTDCNACGRVLYML